MGIKFTGSKSADYAFSCREEMLTHDIRLDVSRRNTRGGQAFGLDFLLDDLIVVQFVSFCGLKWLFVVALDLAAKRIDQRRDESL